MECLLRYGSGHTAVLSKGRKTGACTRCLLRCNCWELEWVSGIVCSHSGSLPSSCLKRIGCATAEFVLPARCASDVRERKSSDQSASALLDRTGCARAVGRQSPRSHHVLTRQRTTLPSAHINYQPLGPAAQLAGTANPAPWNTCVGISHFCVHTLSCQGGRQQRDKVHLALLRHMEVGRNCLWHLRYSAVGYWTSGIVTVSYTDWCCWHPRGS
jgi:hypothetical protein